jgi:hypothetical protein
VPETPEQFYARAMGSLRTPPLQEWATFPFDGEMRPRPLIPPPDGESARRGEGGLDCPACSAPDGDYLWASARWRLRAPDHPTGLPVVLLLEPRAHHSEPGDLPDDLAAELGIMSPASTAPSADWAT